MYLMEQMMRWFGPNDPVSLSDIRQAGCTGVVTALHQIPVGDVWGTDEIEKRKKLIEEAGMKWTVVESLPVHEDIKKHSGQFKKYIENYKLSLNNLAYAGIKVVTYNFMPILDWVRTDIDFELPNGARALRFEKSAFIAFDVFLLKRPGAENDYEPGEISRAKERLEEMSEEERKTLFRNALLGLPGSDIPFTPEEILSALNTYAEIDPIKLKKHLFYFLSEVIPVAEKSGLKMAIHPDDPPFSLLGLPRVVCTEQDLNDLLNAVNSPANGICFCTGSLGARKDNDLTGMVKRIGDKIHFLHLRNTRRDEAGNFFEADHLSGDADMPSIVKEILLIMEKNKIRIPMRPDHGHQMLDDLKKKTYPGYSAIGRLKGLAELRGLEWGIFNSVFR
ncbi:MAG: mannonate dehydratase [Bacteroidetes bacterium]|nr:MAG: mannonate dehydratase [Bacteroidota bacterium]